MKTHRRYQIWSVIAILTLAILACNFITGERPGEAPTLTEAVLPVSTPTPVPATTDEPPKDPVSTQPASEPTAVEPTAEPTQTMPPDDVLAITTLHTYQDSFNNWYVVGLIANNTDQAVDNIEIEVDVTDTNGQSIYSEITNALLYTLAPGEMSPFSIGIFEELPGVDDFSVELVGHSTAEIARPQVEIHNTSLIQDDDGDFHVTGEIFNPNEVPIQINGLAAATFNQNDELMGADFFSVSIRYLDPGESGPFRVTITGPFGGGENINQYELYTDVELVQAEGIYDLIFSDSHSNYLDNYGTFHLVGEVTNNTETNLSVSLVAAIYDVEGKVIDASTQDVVVPLSPGETLPYDFNFWGPMNYLSTAIDLADSYTVQWDPYWTWESSFEYIDLTTQNETNEFDEFQGTFTGEVVNDSGGLINSATVVIALYDKETGDLVATDYTTIFEDIPNGERVEYEITIIPESNFGLESVEYVTFAKGELP